MGEVHTHSDPANYQLPKWIWPTLIISMFGGIALQTSMLAVVLVALSPFLKPAWEQLKSEPVLSTSTLLLIALMLWLGFATVVNTDNPANFKIINHWFGYLPIIVFPALLARFAPPRLHWLPVVTIAALAILTFTQWKVGWSLRALSGGVDFRPKGFYSHPLTLAYISLLLWPMALLWVHERPRSWINWVPVFSCGWLLFVTQSRTCQAIAILILLWSLAVRLSRWMRLAAFAVVIATVALVLVTDNPVSQRFAMTFQEDSPDRFSDYPDDRVAFWHAHWLMIKERPYLGHGIHLNTSYRTPYYHKLGLFDFERPYSAHNQYIQITAEGGVGGAMIFAAWLISLWLASLQIHDRDRRLMFQQTLIAFALGGLTQNVFMDATVRNVLTVVLAWMMMEVLASREQKAFTTLGRASSG